MLLEEQFLPYCDNEYANREDNAANCVEVADESAVGFAEWCIEWRVEFVDSTREGILYTYGGTTQKYTMTELLEIYKKEKGL